MTAYDPFGLLRTATVWPFMIGTLLMSNASKTFLEACNRAMSAAITQHGKNSTAAVLALRNSPVGIFVPESPWVVAAREERIASERVLVDLFGPRRILN